MLALLAQAHRAGVRIIADDSGRTVFAGPASITRELETYRKHILYWLRQGRVYLDWHRYEYRYYETGCTLCCNVRDDRGRHPKDCGNCGGRHRQPDPCVICGRTAHFEEDGQVVLKACAEQHAWKLLQALTTDQKNAA